MKYIFLALTIIGIFTNFVIAAWERTHGGIQSDCAYSIIRNSDGDYLMVGNTNSYGIGERDIYLVKVNDSGDTIWTRTYGGTNNDFGFSVAQTSSGGYIIAGATTSYGSGLGDVYLILTDSLGVTVWTRTYGGSDADYGGSVIQTDEGGFMVAGYTWSFGAGAADIYVIKTNMQGDTIWTRTFGGSESEWAGKIIQTLEGDYIIAGDTWSSGGYAPDAYLVKINSAGDEIWSQTYGGIGQERATCILQTPEGGLILGGYTDSYGGGAQDVYIIKIDSEGDTLWSKTYGAGGMDACSDICITPDHSIILCGVTASFGSGNIDVYIIKVASMGNALWEGSFGGTQEDFGNSITSTVEGGCIIVGGTKSFGEGVPEFHNFYLVGLDSMDFTGIEETYNSPIQHFTLGAYPNPFNSSITITLEIDYNFSLRDKPTIEIYDLQGRKVDLVARDPVPPGSPEPRVPGSPSFIWTPSPSTPSGIYLVSMKVGKQSISKKILYIK